MSRFSIIVSLLFALSVKAQSPLDHAGCKHHAHSHQGVQARSQVSADFMPVRIQSQELRVTLNPDQRYIAGEVEYALSLSSFRQELAVDLDQALRVDSVWSPTGAIAFRQNALQLWLNRGAAGWQADSLYRFTIRYAGVPPVNPNGFGSFMTAKHGPDSVPVLWTLSQPYGCRDWWPAFQALGIRADTTRLVANIPKGMRIGGPGLLKQIDSISNRVVYHWEHSYSMPPYLLGLAVSEYEVLEQRIPIAGTNDTVYVLDYVYREDTAYAFLKLRELLPPMLQRFSDLFGPYPYLREKYGHMQISIFSGGMEHSTMSSMGSWDYSLMVHELAHQWFGNMVTCASWRDIWVNEGFATWMVSLCLEDLLDNGFWWPGWKRLTRESAWRVPQGSIYVRDTALTTTIFFQRLTYHKASFVLHALRYQLGDSAVFAGLRNYLTDPALQWAFATTEHIRFHLEQASGKDLRNYFDRYIYGEGYPRYRLRWSQNNGQLRLHLQQLSPDQRLFPFKLDLPVRLYFSGDSLDLRLPFDGSQQAYNFDISRPVDSLLFDPDINILMLPAVVQRQAFAAASNFKVLTGDGLWQLELPLEASPNEELQLWDVQGRLLWQYRPAAGERSLILPWEPSWKAGIYVLTWQSENDRQVQKISLLNR
jgi:aminopeptidase N